MKLPNLQKMSVDQLVDAFVEIAIAQELAITRGENSKFNRLFKQMSAICDELRDRDGDQRRSLLRLYNYKNMYVRLVAAQNTLAVAYGEARAQLEAIVASKWYPQSAEAATSLWNLDRGVFKPT